MARPGMAGRAQSPHAMTLATTIAGGSASARVVLLKGVDERGFVFYTNLESRKSTGAVRQPSRGALLYVEVAEPSGPRSRASSSWLETRRPTPISRAGRATARSAPGRPTNRDRSPSRADLERRVDEFSRRHLPSSEVPRPPYWSGFRIIPQRIEFWQERPFRLHDRSVSSSGTARDGDGNGFSRNPRSTCRPAPAARRPTPRSQRRPC